MPTQVLTDRFCSTVAHPASGQVLHFDDHKDAPAGFALRVTPGAKSWILNYYTEGRQRRVTLPVGFGESPLWGPKRARLEASKLKTGIHAGIDPLGERERARKAREHAKAETVRKKDFGFGALLEAYAEHLKAAGKPSWRQVSGAIKRHITDPRDALAKMPADEVTVDDVMPVFHALAKDGKLREAEKLRAYLRAAYTSARKARTDATMHAFAGFAIRVNPLADLDVSRPKEAADKAAGASNGRVWALSEAQLAAYWRRIRADESPAGALLQFHLLTGGQRVEQLARLTVRDLDSDLHTVRLLDTKGRRQRAREHVVPLIPDAEAALLRMRGDKPAGDFLFTLDGGASAAGYHSAWDAVHAVCKSMIAAKEVDRSFTPGTIRKTVETRLASKGIADEVLARLLSHGLGGVQARNYNAHHYNDEKRAALVRLRELLSPSQSKVIPIGRGRKARGMR